jgi:hypothetical protein
MTVSSGIGQRLEDAGISSAEVFVVARPELLPAADLDGKSAITVEFQLVKPARPLRQLVGAQEEHRLDEAGHELGLCPHSSISCIVNPRRGD